MNETVDIPVLGTHIDDEGGEETEKASELILEPTTFV